MPSKIDKMPSKKISKKPSIMFKKPSPATMAGPAMPPKADIKISDEVKFAPAMSMKVIETMITSDETEANILIPMCLFSFLLIYLPSRFFLTLVTYHNREFCSLKSTFVEAFV